MFAAGAADREVAQAFRVSLMSANRWHRAFDAGGVEALASKGPGGAHCRLDDTELAGLQEALDAGPAAHGWADQCWTLARIAVLIEDMFRVDYTLGGVCYLLHRVGWSVQVPTRQATERDDDRVAAWKTEVWPAVKGRRATWVPGCASRTRQARG
jgi:putative transposase